MTREGAYDSLREVPKMKSREQITYTVDSWIDQEELPIRPGLKVIKGFNPYEGMDDEEIEAYRGFFSWYLAHEHAVLLSIPKPGPAYDFWPFESDESGNNVSAFNTIDYQRLHPDSFNKCAYRIKKVMEEIKDLAIMHSSITSAQGRLNTLKRYENLVENEFRDRLVSLAKQHKLTRDEERRLELKKKIGAISRRILEAKEIWGRYAPPENWDT